MRKQNLKYLVKDHTAIKDNTLRFRLELGLLTQVTTYYIALLGSNYKLLISITIFNIIYSMIYNNNSS